MIMTPSRMIAFRMLNLTLCRLRSGDRAVRAMLTRLLTPSDAAQPPYCQSADFFSFDQITPDSTASSAGKSERPQA
jgi:hypothetical protein